MTKITALTLVLAGALSAAENQAATRLQAAGEVLTEIMSAGDKAIPQELLDRAECVVVVPGMKKGAFIVGAKYGRGFVSCRRSGGVGWSNPGAVRIEGGSFGIQIGGAETDVVMLVMNRRGADRMLGSRFTLGGDASVAAGPVGRDASAQTDARMTAEILTWSRQRGVFAGLSLSGATLREDGDWNQEMYGRKLHNKAIVRGAETRRPAGADAFLSVLNRYSSRKGR